ncbi:MAG: hypothetical protein LBT76_03305 [Tannerella sp.]|nr:hypothetical protein [Tannerella sp.]
MKEEVCFLRAQNEKLMERESQLQNLNVNLRKETEFALRSMERKNLAKIGSMEKKHEKERKKEEDREAQIRELTDKLIQFENLDVSYRKLYAENEELKRKIAVYEAERQQERIWQDSRQVKQLKKQLFDAERELEYMNVDMMQKDEMIETLKLQLR